VRDAVAGFLRKRMTIVTAASGAGWTRPHEPGPSPRVIDLEDGEFSRTDDEDPPQVGDRRRP